MVDKTRNLVVRTNVLVQNLDRPAGTHTTTTTTTRNIGGNDFAAFRQRGQQRNPGNVINNFYSFGGDFNGKRIR